MRIYKTVITSLNPNQIFVFGSNTEGRHGKGAALFAFKHCGAKYRQPYGLQGRSFAIVTKDLTKREHPSISPEHIIEQIKSLYALANVTPDKEYIVPYGGNGTTLNGYSPAAMAKMFKAAGPIPDNMAFREDFARIIRYNYT